MQSDRAKKKRKKIKQLKDLKTNGIVNKICKPFFLIIFLRKNRCLKNPDFCIVLPSYEMQSERNQKAVRKAQPVERRAANAS